MGTYSFFENKKYKFWKVDVVQEKYPIKTNIENGTVIKANSKEGLYIKAKDGIVRVLEIQAENAKRMNINDFLRGNNIEIGKKFE